MNVKKSVAIVLAVISILTVIFCCPFSASAATINTKYPTSNITGYILSTSNKTAVAYSSINGSKVGYIYASDDCTIQAVYTNGWVKAKVPWSGYSNGRIVYTKLSYFLNTSYTPKRLKVTTKTAAYSRKDLSKRLGYAYVNDNCYIVGESGNYYQTLCPWTGNVYRICWVSKSAFGHTHSYTTSYEAAHPHRVYKKCSCGYYYYTGETKKVSSCSTCYPSSKTTSLVHPMNNYHTKYTQWGAKVSYMSAPRNYHIGVDYASNSDSNIYSVANGTVVAVGTNSANGKYIIIKHTISGKAIYSFYAHLSSYNVSKGSSVSKGGKIGVVGKTGSANNVIHLHFAFVDTLWTGGGYYGYATSFSGNKVTYGGVTYYNPYYVINNGKLP
ncbi:MAG: M23 family metallopeptidase [Acutalibacteraceae bacterium]